MSKKQMTSRSHVRALECRLRRIAKNGNLSVQLMFFTFDSSVAFLYLYMRGLFKKFQDSFWWTYTLVLSTSEQCPSVCMRLFEHSCQCSRAFCNIPHLSDHIDFNLFSFILSVTFHCVMGDYGGCGCNRVLGFIEQVVFFLGYGPVNMNLLVVC